MIKCNCEKGFVHGATGPESWTEECDLCNGSGELSFFQWLILNGWAFDGIVYQYAISSGWYEVDEDEKVYFIDRDFERFDLKMKATVQSITDLLNEER
jgi:hypothetical protein